MLLVRMGLLASASASLKIDTMRLGIFKAKETVGVDCGDDGVQQWPRIKVGSNTVEITRAATCSECYVIDNEGTGCDGDCDWDDEKSICVGEKDDGGLEACEIAAIVIGSLVFLLLLAIIIYFCVIAKSDKNNKETQEERERKKRQEFERERRESLDRQAQMERATPGAAEQAREQVRDPSLLPPPRTTHRSSVPSLHPAADMLEAVTVSNVVVGMEVVRGRSWSFHDQDGGNGNVGTVEGCIKAPNWWWVNWPGTAKHAYYCGDNASDRCDLAVKP